MFKSRTLKYFFLCAAIAGIYDLWSVLLPPDESQLKNIADSSQEGSNGAENNPNEEARLANVKAMADFLEKNPDYAIKGRDLSSNSPQIEATPDPNSIEHFVNSAKELENLNLQDPANIKKYDDLIEKVGLALKETASDQIERKTQLLSVLEQLGMHYAPNELKSSILEQIESTYSSTDAAAISFSQIALNAYLNLESDPEIKREITKKYSNSYSSTQTENTQNQNTGAPNQPEYNPGQSENFPNQVENPPSQVENPENTPANPFIQQVDPPDNSYTQPETPTE